MERCVVQEEKVTKDILNWLEKNGWKIICYDFPQSGTGVLLHLNSDKRTEKNKGGIIPDIVAVKNNTGILFENKDRFYAPDFDKLHEIKTQSNYSNSLEQLLAGMNVKMIYYGVGVPELKINIEKFKPHLEKIDFLISTNKEGELKVHFDSKKVFT